MVGAIDEQQTMVKVIAPVFLTWHFSLVLVTLASTRKLQGIGTGEIDPMAEEISGSAFDGAVDGGLR